MGERPAPRPGIDPEFTDDDAEEILDFLAWKKSLCPGCGEPKHESFSEEYEDAYVGEALRCHSCRVKEAATSNVKDRRGLYSYSAKKPGR